MKPEELRQICGSPNNEWRTGGQTWLAGLSRCVELDADDRRPRKE